MANDKNFKVKNGLDVGGTISSTGGSSTNWNTAFGWGNHATPGYLLGTTAASTYLPFTGGNLTGNLNFNNTSRATFGLSSTLQIYSDSANSFIEESGAGALFVKAANLYFRNPSNESCIDVVSNGTVTLYHNNFARLATTVAGISVTGTISATNYNDANWNTAYGWGNHAAAGYLLSSTAASTYLPLAGGTLTDTLNGTAADFSGNVDANQFRINGTTVIDSSGNLTNIGTISSGAITSNGNLTVKGSSGFNASGETASIYLGDTASEIRATYDGGTKFFVNGTDRMEIEGTSGNLNLKTGAFEIGGTTVIDSSLNLTNVTIKQFTPSAFSPYISPTNANTLNAGWGQDTDIADMWINYRGYQDGWTRFRDFRIGDGKGTGLLFVDGSTKAFDFQAGSFLQIGGQTIIDSNRNLTNIGTISSGAITSSGRLDITTDSSISEPYAALGITSTTTSAGLFLHGNGGRKYEIQSINTGELVFYDRTSGAYRARIMANGNFKIESGALQLGGTTVIDSSRNLTNIGTISSNGTVTINTVAGTLVIEDFGAGSNKIRSNGSLKLAATGSVALQHGATERLETTSSGVVVTGDVNASGLLKVGTNDTEYANNYIRFKSAGAAYIDHFTVGQDINFRLSDGSSLDKTVLTIDNNGQLHATSTTNVRLTLGSEGTTGNNSSNWIRGNTNRLQFNTAGGDYNWEVIGSTKMTLTSAGVLNPVGGYQVNGTTVIDSSRNLTSINAITSTGVAAITRGNGSVGAPDTANHDTGTRIELYNANATSWYAIGIQSETMWFNSDNHYRFYVDAVSKVDFDGSGVVNAVGGYKVNGTTVIDASRNLTNIAAITASGTVNAAGLNLNNASTSYISNTSGVLYIDQNQNDGNMVFRNDNGSGGLAEYIVVDGGGGSVLLKHYGSTKFQTSSTGVSVTGGITTVGASVFNGTSSTDPDATSRSRYPAANMFTHTTQANGVSIIGGQGNFSGSSLTIGEETARSTAFKFIRGISDTNGAVAEEFSIDGVGNAVFAGLVRSGVGYQIGSTTVIDASRNLINVQPNATTAEYGISMVGNFGQWQAHSAYASGFNTVPAYWGWNYVQGNINAPNTLSNQWYRNRVSLGNNYGKGSDANDYWCEMAYPRYNQSTAGHMWMRVAEGGSAGAWSQVGSSIIGNFTATGNVTAYSDERLKSDIKTLDGKKVLQMRGVSFTKDGEDGSGVIAQELEKVAPELVQNGEEYKSVAYGNITGYLIELAKEQQKEIDELKLIVKQLLEQ